MLLPSSHCPIPLVRRSDLVVSPLSTRDDEYVLVKDPLTLTYFQLPMLQYRVLAALDGQRSLNEILSQIPQTEVASAIGVADIFRFIVDLANKRLIWSRRAGTVDGILSQSDGEDWRRLWAVIRNPFFIQLPGVYPGTILTEGARLFGWVYSVPALMFVAAFVLLTWACLILRAEAFAQELPSIKVMLSGSSWWMLWGVIGFLKIAHELSHGLACERFGAHCQSIGFAFLFFSPCMYCDVSDAWLLEKKSHRIAISLAGVYFELFLSAVGYWCWRCSGPGLLHVLGLQVFLAGSLATLLFNANPLLRFDGYYVLADMLEIPNLYQRSRKAVRRLAARCFLGIRIAEMESVRENQSRSMLLTYGLASMAYQTPMFFGIWLFFRHFFESLGLIAIPLCYLLITIMILFRRIFSCGLAINQGHPGVKPSRLNMTVTTTCVIVLLTGIWFCPTGSSITAPVVIEPCAATPVYVETPGTVSKVCAIEGDFVDEGTILVELEDLVLDRRLALLEGLRATHDVDFRMAQSIGDPDLMTLAKTARESVSEQMEQAKADKERLILRAGISGQVMSANESPANLSSETSGQRNASLNSQLIGSYLNRRSCVCQIVPSDQWQAMILVDQRHRQYLSIGQTVMVRLDAFSGTDIKGVIQTVGAANEMTIPAAMSSKFGGSFHSRTSTDREVPTEPVYHAILLLDNVKIPAQPGMRGIGRFARPSMTVGSWLIDELHRVFVVR